MSITLNVENFIKESLANHLGISVDDISPDDYLKDDLHMGASDISDLIHRVSEKYQIDPAVIPDIETVQDIIDIVSERENF